MTELTTEKIRVVVVDDHPVARAGIRSALEACEQLNVVAEAPCGEEAVLLVRELLPHVMVMDIELPGMDGFDVARLLSQELPDIKIILLSIHENAAYVERARRSGVSRYLLKNTPLEQLVESVLAAGGTRSIPEQRAPELPPLSTRDERILALVAAGRNSREIAVVMGLKPRTVVSYRHTLKQKLGIPTTAGLVKYAIARGLVPEPVPGQDVE